MRNHLQKTLAATRRRAQVIPNKKTQYSERWEQKEMQFEADKYTTWMQEVDTILAESFYISHMSMPDFRWRDCFDADLKPWDAVDDAVEYWEQDFPGARATWEQYITSQVPYA